MALWKNVASQKMPVFARNELTGAAVTGDAANITAQISKDGGASAATDDANPTELDATDHKGVYLFDMLQAETNADLIVLSAVSSTSNVKLDPVEAYPDNPAVVADAAWDEMRADHTAAGSMGEAMKVLIGLAIGRCEFDYDPDAPKLHVYDENEVLIKTLNLTKVAGTTKVRLDPV